MYTLLMVPLSSLWWLVVRMLFICRILILSILLMGYMPNCLVGKRLNYFVVLSAASMVPHRKSDLSKVVVSALFTGACVSLISACVAGKCLSLVSEYCFNSPSHICIEKAPNLQCSQFIPKELRALRNMCKSFPLASLSPLPRNPLCPQGS